MPIRFGGPELLIVLAIVLLIFGVGRVGKIGGELGSAIRQFRDGLTGGDKDKDKAAEDKRDEPKAS
jgi:sec-independent protein translocase protein TatA